MFLIDYLSIYICKYIYTNSTHTHTPIHSPSTSHPTNPQTPTPPSPSPRSPTLSLIHHHPSPHLTSPLIHPHSHDFLIGPSDLLLYFLSFVCISTCLPSTYHNFHQPHTSRPSTYLKKCTSYPYPLPIAHCTQIAIPNPIPNSRFPIPPTNQQTHARVYIRSKNREINE